MSNKYIKLSFRDAKLFPKNVKTKDFVSDLSVASKNRLVLLRSARCKGVNNNFKEPITVHQVSNMLHTLIGERPVPSFRKVFYNRNEMIFQLANNSLLKIDSPKTLKNIKGDIVESFIGETIRIGKSPKDSWSKPSKVYWFKIKKYLGKDFENFIKLINDALGYDVQTTPFEDLFNSYEVHGSKLDTVISYLKSINRTPIVNFLTKSDFERSEIYKSGTLRECVISGIDTVNILSGEILVPYDMDFISKIIKNTTNILDGGFVKIEGIFYSDEIEDSSSFVKMSEISDEKY